MKASGFIISLVIAAVFVAGVGWFSGVGLSDIAERVSACRPSFLGLALGAYAGSYLCRALRFRVLLRSEGPSLVGLFCVVAVHNLMNMILPARTGELSYVYLLRSRFHVSSSSGVATLVVARVLDLLCLLLFLGLGLLFYSQSFDGQIPSLLAACAAILLFAFAVFLNLSRIARAGLLLLRKIAALTGLTGRRWADMILSKGQEVEDAFQAIRSRPILSLAFLWSVLIWLGIFLTCYLILLSMGVNDYTFGESIVGTSALNATCILPINSLGNLGTWEAGWAAGYLFLGMDKELAVETGAGEHIVIFCFGLLLWLIGWMGLKARGRQTDSFQSGEG
jgi:uncharacterized protein (TIRG00374 family)